MNKIIRNLQIISVAFMATSLCATVSASEVFSDTFEHGERVTDLNGKLMTDNTTTYAVANQNAIFQTVTPADASLGLGDYAGRFYVNPGSTSSYVTTSANVAEIESYEFNIGYLMYTGGGRFGINVRSTENSINGGYLLSWVGNTVSIAYVDSMGTEISLGTVRSQASDRASAYYLTDIQVVVTGSYQQLSVGGVEIGTTLLTQSTYDATGTENIRFYALGNMSAAADLQIDNISAAVIPEVSTSVSLISGAVALGVIGYRIRRRIING